MTNVQRYRFNAALTCFTRHDEATNQQLRNHPGDPQKDRSTETDFPARLAARRVRTGAAAAPRQFLLDPRKEVKAVGYASDHVATTGTSKPGVLCATDGLDLCFAVGVGGRNPGTGEAKARVFHMMPHQRPLPVARHVQALKDQGYEVKAALHGGDAGSAASAHAIDAMGALLRGLDVPIEFNDTAGDSRRNGTFGAVVEDGDVRFVTQLVSPGRR